MAPPTLGLGLSGSEVSTDSGSIHSATAAKLRQLLPLLRGRLQQAVWSVSTVRLKILAAR